MRMSKVVGSGYTTTIRKIKVGHFTHLRVSEVITKKWFSLHSLSVISSA
uniref:Uncharacterized protein n=1 Tax=Utricularia reniformis TaxID=192314 RepID=A0A1Y0AZH8_9LAMI|nr:hypothetical protein AEK19_MT0266 [Utricularia reniformis]ART30543.1 hypothetical protein AEK19_MT0266 [Utricularia reniformis]